MPVSRPTCWSRFSADVVCAAVALLLPLVFPSVSAAPASDGMLAILRFSNSTHDARFDQFHLVLRKRLEYEMLFPGLPIKAWDATYEHMGALDPADTSRFRFIVYGAFGVDSVSKETVCTFSVMNRNLGRQSTKKVVLRGIAIDELADIVVLKTTGFLRRNILARLDIGSNPAGCPVTLNGVSAGLTPQEFSLEPGRYTVEIQGDFLEPYRIQVDLSPGGHNELHPRMTFKGYPTLWWLTGAIVSTIAAGAAYGVESDLRSAYMNIPAGREAAEYDQRFDAYRRANRVRLSLQHIAVVPWTATAFSFFVNRSLRRRIMGE